MSDQRPIKYGTRATTYLPLVAGMEFGRPLSEIAYVTPRFPSGIRRGDLHKVDEAMQCGTMVVWYLANLIPAAGPYFGFAQSQPALDTGELNGAPLNTFAINDGPHIAGFGKGRFFRGGGWAPELLTAEFGENVSTGAIGKVASVFDGLWEWKPEQPVADYVTFEDVRAAIAAALDEFESHFKGLPPQHGGIGHNGPPEDEPLTPGNRLIVLKAVSNMRLAIASRAPPSALRTIWSSVLNIMPKIGVWALEKINLLLNSAIIAAGTSLGAFAVAKALEICFHASNISGLINLLEAAK